jgi:hypothetical protein
LIPENPLQSYGETIMAQINKVDFFVGVFLTEILGSAKTVPALFDGEQNDNKRIEFETNKGIFNIYIKYSMNKKGIPFLDKGKKKTKYIGNVLFSETEYDKFVNSSTNKKLSYVVIVWTNASLTNTWLVVLDYEKAMKCLKSKTETGNRRIKVTRYGAGHEFYCQGVDFKDDEFVTCSFDHITYFQQIEDKEPIPA